MIVLAAASMAATCGFAAQQGAMVNGEYVITVRSA